MRPRLPAHHALDAELQRIHDERLAVIALDRLPDLVRAPEVDPFVASRSPRRSGVEELGATLTAAKRLPDSLTVRVLLPAGAAIEPSVPEVQAAFHREAAYQSGVAWRDGMAIRSMGLRQLPLGMTVAIIAWVISSVAALVARDSDGLTMIAAAVLAMVALTIAWVLSWQVVEFTMVDWRLGARRADAYDLLARATLEVVVEDGPAAA
jgi:hypothetical protein